MKKKVIIIISLLILAGIIFAILPFLKPEKEVAQIDYSRPGPVDVGQGIIIEPDLPPPPQEVKVPEEFKNLSKKELGSLTNKVIDALPRFSKMKKIADASNKEIDFYGKYVDQYGEPIANANIKYDIAVSQFMGGWVTRDGETTTNNQGIFKIKDDNGGENYGVTKVIKEGYDFSGHRQRWSTWGRADRPIADTSYDTPAIYKGWKIEEVADIKKITVLGEMIPDGRSYTASITLNSTNQIIWKEGDDGDVNISINRDVTPDERSWFSSDFRSWSLTITIKNGGVVHIPFEQNDGYHFFAPENGYSSTIKVSSKKEDGDWTKEFKGHYYISLRGGQIYGRVRVYSKPLSRRDSSGALLRLELNFDGSRNLFSKSE